MAKKLPVILRLIVFESMYMGQMSKPMTEYDWLNYSCKGEEAIFFCHSV